MRSLVQTLLRVLRILDTLTLAGTASVCWNASELGSQLEFLIVLAIIPLNTSLLQYYGLYESHRVEGSGHLIRGLLSAQVATMALASGLFLLAGMPGGLDNLAVYAAATTSILLIQRSALYAALHHFRRRGFDVRKVCVIGSLTAAQELSRRLSANAGWGMKVCYWGECRESEDFFTFPGDESLQSGFAQFLRRYAVDEVLILCRAGQVEQHKVLLTVCKDYGVNARLVIEHEAQELAGSAQAEEFAGTMAFAVSTPQVGWETLAKRVIDVAGAAVLLVVLAPLLLVIAIMVKLSSPGPVLFAQQRMGRGGQHFTMYKFRTMVTGAEGMLPALAARNITDGPAFKSKDDWRVTPVGRWLRRYSLDELPQLLNVCRGNMSLVGPRPLPVAEALGVDESYCRRFSVRPGLTCFWQVSGRSDITFASWMRMDIEYVDSWSLWLDTKLLLRTIPAVISGRGAY